MQVQCKKRINLTASFIGLVWIALLYFALCLFIFFSLAKTVVWQKFKVIITLYAKRQQADTLAQQSAHTHAYNASRLSCNNKNGIRFNLMRHKSVYLWFRYRLWLWLYEIIGIPIVIWCQWINWTVSNAFRTVQDSIECERRKYDDKN